MAPTEASILLRGETGSGKGLAARTLHRLSRRAAGPLVHVDCAALAASVIESELFGHERGAFTGAERRRVGRFEQAAGGTLLLDEIGDLALPLQAKLLRVLQERTFERVGGNASLPLDARVVAATHCDLEAAVESGGFRRDLYYRLSVVRIDVPPLRDRIEDLRGLVSEELRRLSERHDCVAPLLDDDLLRRLEGHGWPGNVRELQNLLESWVVRHPGERLGAELFAPGPRSREDSARGCDAGRAPDLLAELARRGGNLSATARDLGLTRSALRYRLQQYAFSPPEPGAPAR